MQRPIVPELSGDEYLRWESSRPGKFELHHGFILTFAGGTFEHDRISINLTTLLDSAFAAPCQSFGSDIKIRVADDTFFYCDAGVIREETASDALYLTSPRIVCEVVSTSSETVDTVHKRSSYRRLPSLEAYVIVRMDVARVEVDERAADGSWQTSTYDSAGAFILDALIPLRDIYARTILRSSNFSTSRRLKRRSQNACCALRTAFRPHITTWLRDPVKSKWTGARILD